LQTRMRDQETSVQADGAKGDFAALQEPPSNPCNHCSRELGTPGMLFLGTVPGSQLAALLSLAVNERNSGFRCYPPSFQNPTVCQEGRCFSKGNTNLFSAIQPAEEDSSQRAGGSITVIGIHTTAVFMPKPIMWHFPGPFCPLTSTATHSSHCTHSTTTGVQLQYSYQVRKFVPVTTRDHPTFSSTPSARQDSVPPPGQVLTTHWMVAVLSLEPLPA